MLSSLLSFYIATSIQPKLMETTNFETNSPEEIIYTSQESTSSFQNFNSGPVKDPHFISPIIGATGSIAIDTESNSILFEKNAHQRLSMASITKLMTMAVVLEENELNEIVTVSSNAAATEGSTMYLAAGEQLTVEDLLYGVIIQSGNDAAVALAEHNAGSVSNFVDKMNSKAKQLGLINTHYANPTGLDHYDNYSTAYDISQLAQYVYSKDFVKKAAKLETHTVTSISGTNTHNLTSTNELLGSYLNVKGLKTGKTQSAGLCLVAIAENDQNHDIITVVLNSPDRFQESKILIDWVFRAYNWN